MSAFMSPGSLDSCLSTETVMEVSPVGLFEEGVALWNQDFRPGGDFSLAGTALPGELLQFLDDRRGFALRQRKSRQPRLRSRNNSRRKPFTPRRIVEDGEIALAAVTAEARG